MKLNLKNWDLMRILRLALGIFIIVQGIVLNDWMNIALGSIFSAMPLFNIGCCGTSACSTTPKKDTSNTKDIQYEEVH
jgi:hypothetical protein